MRRFLPLLFALLCLTSLSGWSQGKLSVILVDGETGKPVPDAEVTLDPLAEMGTTDVQGRVVFGPIPNGKYKLITSSPIFGPVTKVVEMVGADVKLVLELDSAEVSLDQVDIHDSYGTAAFLRSVEGTSIYAAKKTELIRIESLTANLATNNPRQVFARVAGLNIWESDGGGLQIGIGGRGLSPNRTANFNTRQNGYDISADALGYPESYYSPPTEALERIEVVRGAASLQYGTQFGGMLNFIFKQGPKDQKFQFVTRQTAGSFGLFSSFNSVGGTLGKVNYYGFYQGKRSDGWRPNAGFRQHTAFGSVRVQATKRMSLGGEYTFMDYLAQQPGGLTDALFEQDPRQSIRDRNWFHVRWNLAAFHLDAVLGKHSRFNWRSFGLMAEREALGFLGSINRTDPLTDRDLISGTFQNWGTELRLLHKLQVLGHPAAVLVGSRVYQGKTTAAQGFASAGSDANFQFLNPEKPDWSDYSFPSLNISGFSELLLNPTARLSITPGIRFEHIRTQSQGRFTQRVTDLAGNVIFEEDLYDDRNLARSLVLAGLGMGYRLNEHLETYANFSQNYRAITFSDLRIVNPNFKIDPNLEDERGFNADWGLRGKVGEWLDLDVSAYFLYYFDRIGQVLSRDSVSLQFFRYRTNVANSRNIGIEWYSEANLMSLFGAAKSDWQVSLFTNASFTDARYVDSKEAAFDGKRVELAPPVIVKGGVNAAWKRWKGSWQWSWTAQQFSDATNAEFSPNAVEGLIPSYDVMDASLQYSWKWLTLQTGCNNVLSRKYFTRRAESYPGPGIIPSDGRSFYGTVQLKF